MEEKEKLNLFFKYFWNFIKEKSSAHKLLRGVFLFWFFSAWEVYLE